ncbi:MAG: TolC family protein [Myxococcota bacterium]
MKAKVFLLAVGPAVLLALPAIAEETTTPPRPAVLTLPEVLARAETSCLDVTLLREKLVQAEASLGKAWSAVLPTIQGVGSYTRNSVASVIPFPDFRAGFGPSPNAPPDVNDLGSLRVYPMSLLNIEVQPQDQWVGTAQASMPLFIAPAYYAIAAARRAVDLTENSVAHAKDELFFGIAQLYYGSVATARVVELAERQLGGASESERVARSRYQAGELARIGFLRAGVERARAEQDLQRAKNAYATTTLALATLVGIDAPFSVEAPAAVVAPAGDEQKLIDQALASRTDLVASRLGTDVADRLLMATWWKFAPIIAVNGAYRWMNFSGFAGESRTWAVTVNAIWTLYDGGLRHDEIREARSRTREADTQRQKVERAVRQDVKASTLELESARANLTKAQEQNRLATEGAVLAGQLFAAGAATYLDVVDANNAAFAAGVAAVSEELNVQVASLKLAKAIGKLDLAREGTTDS